MGKYLSVLLGIIAILAVHWVNLKNQDSIWIAIYPPPPEKLLMEGLPYLLWFIGIVLILFGITSLFKKK